MDGDRLTQRQEWRTNLTNGRNENEDESVSVQVPVQDVAPERETGRAAKKEGDNERSR